jgi:O-antigen/teichoic acid export membrane protein
MGALTGTEAASRLLSFAYYVIAARVLDPDDFGVVRYTITLAVLAVGPLLVTATATNRELGASRDDPARRDSVLASSLLASAGLWAAGAALAALAVAAGLTGDANLPGLLAATVGLAAFNLYYSVARGLGQLWRIAAAYAGGSAAQLAALGALAALGQPSTTLVLVVFGASALVPIAICEIARPVLWRHARHATREAFRALRRIAAPLWISQIFFLVWISADQIWVANSLGGEQLGFYSAAKTMAQVFFVLTAGANGILLPRVAHLRTTRGDDEARGLIRATVAAVTLAAVLLAAVLILARDPLLTDLYGSDYSSAASSLTGLSVGMAIFVVISCLGAAAVGWGKPILLTLAFGMAGISEAVLLIAIDPAHASGAAWINAASIALGLLVAIAFLIVRPLRPGEPAEDEVAVPLEEGAV